MPPAPSPIKAERIKIAQACAITGKAKRRLQLMAKKGKVPGAAKIWGEWTFDEAKLRAWVRELEDASCPNDQTAAAATTPAAERRRRTQNGAATRFTVASGSMVGSGGGRYKQAMSTLLGSGSRRTSRG